MQFYQFANYLEKLENTPKRLEMASILAELIGKLDEKSIDKTLYLSLGSLKPPFDKEQFNIADKMMIKILQNAFADDQEKVEKLYADLGDLGSVALELSDNTSEKDGDVLKVYEDLLDIAKTSGSGSQERKVNKCVVLIKDLNKLSAKYVTRIILGTTRLGFTELTIIDALSEFLGEGKALREEIESKYNMVPDIGKIAKGIKANGMKGIANITMETGIPILAQKPQRLSDPTEIIEKMGGLVWAEYKLDGTRVQLHMDRNKKVSDKENTQTELFERDKNQIFINTYTRNLEKSTHQFPEILDAAKDQIKADSVVLDGEAIGYDKETGNFLEFQEVIKRKRKHGVKEMADQIPLKYYVFDILYLNGTPLIEKTLKERREILEAVVKKGEVIELSEYVETGDAEELMERFELSKEKHLEGLVIKNPESPYQAGARSYAWIKLKKSATDLIEDDFDCIILGYYFGKGNRSGYSLGAFLAGVYNPEKDCFESLTKVGAGLKEKDLENLSESLEKIKLKEKPQNVEVSKGLIPDVWVTPKTIVVLKADEISKSPSHSAGYALRFPRFMNLRTDKTPTETTSTQEIEQLYKQQKRGYY